MIDTGNGRVLVLVAHPDDEFGCAGLIHRLATNGAEVLYRTFTDCTASMRGGATKHDLEEECRKSLSILAPNAKCVFGSYPVRRLPGYRQEVLEELITIRQAYLPTLVLCPSSFDLHQDHGVVSREASRAFRDVTVLGYELAYNCKTFVPTLYVEMTEETMRTKGKALASYKTQDHRYHGTSDYARVAAQFRGAQCRKRYAEAFEVMLMVCSASAGVIS